MSLDELSREVDGATVTGEEARVRFMLALTDERVRHEQAPFDHP